MTRGTVPAAETAHRSETRISRWQIPAGGGQRTALWAQSLRARRNACPRAEPPYGCCRAG